MREELFQHWKSIHLINLLMLFLIVTYLKRSQLSALSQTYEYLHPTKSLASVVNFEYFKVLCGGID